MKKPLSILIFCILCFSTHVWGEDNRNADRFQIASPRLTANESNARNAALQKPVRAECTDGRVWTNGKCECRNNFYWSDLKKQCRPVRTCPPNQTFDREKDDCVAL
jgi:hypothetical protein